MKHVDNDGYNDVLANIIMDKRFKILGYSLADIIEIDKYLKKNDLKVEDLRYETRR